MAYFTVSSYSSTSYLELTFDHAELTPEQRRGLKLLFDLDVPEWQRESESDKDLTGKLELNLQENRYGHKTPGIVISARISGAYVCRPVEGETVEVPPSEYEVREADRLTDKLNIMTAKEQLAYLKDLATAKAKPKTRPKYECVPAELASDE